MTWQFSSIRLRMYSLFQKYRARSATWDKIKRENEKRVHKQVHSSPPRVHKYYRQTSGRNAPVWKRKLTWKWGLEMQAAICLNRGSCTRINWDGSITSRISSISPRNITCVHVTGLYTVQTHKYFQVHLQSENMSGFQCLNSSATINGNNKQHKPQHLHQPVQIILTSQTLAQAMHFSRSLATITSLVSIHTFYANFVFVIFRFFA